MELEQKLAGLIALMQVELTLVWLMCEWDGTPVCQRLGSQQRGSRLCEAAPGEWTGTEVRGLIGRKLRTHSLHPRRKSQELFEISLDSSLQYSLQCREIAAYTVWSLLTEGCGNFLL